MGQTRFWLIAGKDKICNFFSASSSSPPLHFHVVSGRLHELFLKYSYIKCPARRDGRTGEENDDAFLIVLAEFFVLLNRVWMIF